VALALGVTSCLTLEETYTFNKDGSGNMEFAMDLSQLAAFVEEGPTMDTLFMMGQAFEEMLPQLDEVAGLTDVETFEDRENFKIGLRFAFDDEEALNAALNTVLVAESIDDAHGFFTRSGNSLTRTTLPSSKGVSLPAALAQSFLAEGEGGEEMDFVLESMQYKMSYTFDKRVKVVYADAQAEVSGEDNEQVTLTTNFKELLGREEYLSASFVLK